MVSQIFRIVFLLFLSGLALAGDFPKRSSQVAKVEMLHSIDQGAYSVYPCDDESPSGILYVVDQKNGGAVPFCVQETSPKNELISEVTPAGLFVTNSELKLCFWQMGGGCDYGNGALCIDYQALEDCLDVRP